MNLKQIQVTQNDGITVECEVDPIKLRKIRLINFLEPILVYGIVLAIMWISKLDESKIWWIIIYGILVLWVLFFSPVWHYHGLKERDVFLRPEQRNIWFWIFECRGLGSVKKYYQRDSSGKSGFIRHWDAIMKMTLLWNILFLCVPYAFEDDYNSIVKDLFGDSSTLTRIGAFLIALVVVDFLLIFIIYPFMLRIDNFTDGWNNQLRYLTKYGIPFVLIFNLMFQIFWADLQNLPDAYGMVGADPYTRLDQFNLLDYGGQWAGYIFWGWLQQLLFLSIFSTQFARAFDLKNNKKAPIIVAFCSAFFFGLIHLPNFWLSILTWTAGFFWAICFLENRNLMIMGISHGMLGSLGNKLLPISYNVGPGSI